MQATFFDLEYAAQKKVTRRDRFLGEIEAITPWRARLAQIEPFYPKFVGIDLARESTSYATTLLKFHRLLEKHSREGLQHRFFTNFCVSY
jgi:IS5 family transposase